MHFIGSRGEAGDYNGGQHEDYQETHSGPPAAASSSASASGGGSSTVAAPAGDDDIPF